MIEYDITSQSFLNVSGVVMDLESHTVKLGRKTIRLSRKEFSLLEYLMRHAGKVLTRDMIMEHVWDMNADPFTNTVDVHIRLLRNKLGEGSTKLIQTVHGYGYKFDAE
jgi:two-component system copper resistance phosphate regulon response regulator CusR